MKKTILVFAVLFLSAVGVRAEKQTGDSNWGTPVPSLNEFLNENADHTHDNGRENPVGIGADITVLKTEGILEEVNVEIRGDFVNEETSVYAVAKFDLFGWLKGDE